MILKHEEKLAQCYKAIRETVETQRPGTPVSAVPSLAFRLLGRDLGDWFLSHDVSMLVGDKVDGQAMQDLAEELRRGFYSALSDRAFDELHEKREREAGVDHE